MKILVGFVFKCFLKYNNVWRFRFIGVGVGIGIGVGVVKGDGVGLKKLGKGDGILKGVSCVGVGEGGRFCWGEVIFGDEENGDGVGDKCWEGVGGDKLGEGVIVGVRGVCEGGKFGCKGGDMWGGWVGGSFRGGCVMGGVCVGVVVINVDGEVFRGCCIRNCFEI